MNDKVPYQERTHWEGFMCSDYEEMLCYLKGEAAHDYKDEYVKLLKEGIFYETDSERTPTEDDRYTDFALIEIKGKSPVLLCANKMQNKIIYFDDGLVGMNDEYFDDDLVDMNDEYFDDSKTYYIYPDSGCLEKIYIYNIEGPEEASVDISRYMFRDGSMLGRTYFTNDASVFDKKDIKIDGMAANREKFYKINDVKVSRDEFIKYMNSMKGSERIKILPKEDPACEIQYLSAEKMIKVLEER